MESRKTSLLLADKVKMKESVKISFIVASLVLVSVSSLNIVFAQNTDATLTGKQISQLNTTGNRTMTDNYTISLDISNSLGYGSLYEGLKSQEHSHQDIKQQ
jgi:hypothetical protein